MSNENKGLIPPRWLQCPRKATNLIQNKFLAFKTPLSSAYNNQVPEECRFDIDMLYQSVKGNKLKLGLWIDLTNTTRFYDKKNIEERGCRYLKIPCRGHSETPTEEQTTVFIEICKKFIIQNPLDIIGVHCTHGFNRTGFLIISYLVEAQNCSVDVGLKEFATVRPPGIYKEDYIRELYRRYDDTEDIPCVPPRPLWCLEDDNLNIDDTDEESSIGGKNYEGESHSKKRKHYHFNKVAVFMAGVPGVALVSDRVKSTYIQQRVQEICGWNTTGFPGSQPVSMDSENIKLLHLKPYRVSWKADGTRYMMFIQEEKKIYFIDRDNNVFQINGLAFPHPEEKTKYLRETLMDGEMVIDKDKGKDIPRYLIYDIIMYNGQDISKLPFHPNRYSIIDQKVIAGRLRAIYEKRLVKEREPFSVRLKHFWDVSLSQNLLGEKFASQLSHQPDGLIFQPSKDKYCTGTSPQVLKWKPLSLNSIDFRLKIVTESGLGILSRKVGHLYVGGLKTPYGTIKISRQLKELDNSIIECKYENGQWVFMRQRVDKSYPNSFKTADSICKSIIKPITKEWLLEFIEKYRFTHDDVVLMPPPNKARR